jgi:hypothetical protein
MKRLFFLAGLSLVAGSAFAQGGEMLLVDSGRDVILRISAFDGSIIQDNFIVDAGSGSPFDFQTPNDVDYVGNEIWVSDQVTDAIFRFNRSGGYLGTIGGTSTGQLDNLRGGAVVGNEYWVTVGGTANGATVGVARYDFSGNRLGSFATTGSSPYDILVRANDILIGDATVTGTNIRDIDRYDFSGNLLGSFVLSPGLGFVQQMNLDGSNVLATGFSSNNSTPGIYRFDANGNQTGFWSAGGPRGLTRLGNGNYAYTLSNQLWSLNPNDNSVSLISQINGASFRYFSQVDPIPEPVTMTVLGIGLAAVAARRRRK